MRTKCWMTDETHGEYCLGCGCCAENPIERYESRIYILEERIFELKIKLEDYQNDYSASNRFYNRVNIEKIEDEISENEALIRCYRKEVNKLRKRA